MNEEDFIATIGEMKSEMARIKEDMASLTELCGEPQECPDGYVTTKDMCVALRVSEKTLGRLRARGIIPYKKMGLCCIYQVKNVIASLRRQPAPLIRGLMPDTAINYLKAMAWGRFGKK